MNALLTHPYMAAALALLGLALAGVILAHFRLRHAATRQGIDWKCIQSFRGEFYRPLERLLSPDDYAFLQGQSGYQPALADKLRRERRQIFRGYLTRLERDFTQLHLLARTLVRDQEQDRPELAVALVRTGVEFRWNVWKIRLRLLLQASNLDVAALRPADAKGLVDAAIWMQAQIRLLHAPMAGSAAH